MAATGALSGLDFFHTSGAAGHDFEDVADDAVLGDFEDGGVGILVDGDDGARALHADDVLNRAANAQRQIKFRSYRLAGAADLALHREPAFIANRARGGDLAAKSFRERFGLRNIFGGFDAATDGHDERRLGQVYRRLRFFEDIKRLGAYLLRAQ